MATGGLGGVYCGAVETFDVFTDIDGLARADGSIVVCSGFKSILDLAATLEALETRGLAIGRRRPDGSGAPALHVSALKGDARQKRPGATQTTGDDL
jgi:pseudouridine-5'-phosphate glycosidase